MYEQKFSQRLAQLRLQKGVSARDMSLSIGQNPGYINTIENGKSFPTMINFFYICDFLNVTPKEFFVFDMEDPEKLRNIEEQLEQLDEKQLNAVAAIVNELAKRNWEEIFVQSDFSYCFVTLKSENQSVQLGNTKAWFPHMVWKRFSLLYIEEESTQDNT